MVKPYFSPKVDASLRERVRSPQILNRLQGFFLEELDPTSQKPIQLTPDQVKVGLALLRKTMPDLSNVEMTGAEGGPLVVEVVRFSGDKA